MKKEERLRIYNKYDGHCAYCGKPIKYEEMQVDHLIPKNRGLHYRRDEDGNVTKRQGPDTMENYMPTCRACNFRKSDLSLEQFREEIKRQAEGLRKGAAKFQYKMSLAYGLIVEHLDKPIIFYFENHERI